MQLELDAPVETGKEVTLTLEFDLVDLPPLEIDGRVVWCRPNPHREKGHRCGVHFTPSPEAEALQKAIDAKASNAELKAAMAKYNAARKEKQEALDKAQAELRKVLSVRQEAIAVSSGLL